MAAREFWILINGSEVPRIPIRARFNQPFGPIKALNPAATTTVGSIKGKVEAILSAFFPVKLNLPKRYAAGKPKITVKTVESPACRNVNPAAPPIIFQLVDLFKAEPGWGNDKLTSFPSGKK